MQVFPGGQRTRQAYKTPGRAQDMEGRTGYTVEQAADILGISKDAVRKRIARNTLEAVKGEDGTWTVFLDSGAEDKTDDQDSHFWELIQDQRQEIERLRQELQQKDEWITKLIERIPPQLPAPEPEPEQQPERRPWWKRIFS